VSQSGNHGVRQRSFGVHLAIDFAKAVVSDLLQNLLKDMFKHVFHY